jgi:putative oxidoreductase
MKNKKLKKTAKPWGNFNALSFLSHPATLITLKLIIGALFILASVGKIIDPEKFLSKIREYTLLPMWLEPLFAYTMPWIEFSIGLLLIADLYVKSAALMAIASLGAFIFAIIVQISRGVDMTCGCFDFLIPDEKVGWVAVGRDFFMMALCAVLLFLDKNEARFYGVFRKK